MSSEAAPVSDADDEVWSAASSDGLKDRLNELNEESCGERCFKCLPVLFVFFLISSLLVVYVVHMCRTWEDRLLTMNIVQVSFFTLFLTLLLTSYARASFTCAGDIPNTPMWNCGSSPNEIKTLESKRTGERRYCKWCNKYKPDRSHHCRVCNKCVLKMDHHCPWLHNCVGFRNYKYFLNLIFYAAVCAIYVSVSILPCIIEDFKNLEVVYAIAYIYGEIIGGLLSLVLTLFFFFHVWLLQNGMTTIEFCEKSRELHYRSQYKLGCCKNMTNNFGPHWYLWLLPISPPTGDGCNYESNAESIGFAPKGAEKYLEGEESSTGKRASLESAKKVQTLIESEETSKRSSMESAKKVPTLLESEETSKRSSLESAKKMKEILESEETSKRSSLESAKKGKESIESEENSAGKRSPLESAKKRQDLEDLVDEKEDTESVTLDVV